MRRLRSRCESLIFSAGVGPPERGAVAIIVVLVAIVLFGVAAWVIDGGALYQERRELQRGADFAALTVAADCARGDCGGATGVPALTADAVVDANSTDGQSTVPAGGVTFPTSNRVKVSVVTFDAGANIDGDTGTVDFNFARVFGETGQSLLAEATAEWGVVGAGSSLPLTLSWCEWNDAYLSGSETTIYFHDGTQGNGDPGNGNGNQENAGTCPVGPAGQDADGNGVLPGGFGWLNQDDCVVNLDVTDDGYQWAARKGGNAPPNDCDPPVLGHTLTLPIFDDFINKNDPAWANQCNPPTGSDVGCYRIAGWGSFVVTGFKFPGGQAWRQPNPPPCSAQTSCIKGYFTDALCPRSDCSGGGGTNFGALTVWLVE